MGYFKINNTDFSMYVNELKITSVANYNSQISAAGNMVVDYINEKKEIEVGIIPLTAVAMTQLQTEISKFDMDITFLNPKTNVEETIHCILPEKDIEYYTIQADNIMLKAFTLKFQEL